MTNHLTTEQGMTAMTKFHRNLYRDTAIVLAFLTIIALTALARPVHHTHLPAARPKIGIGTAITLLQDDHRPACFVEPSATPEGYEVIYYPHLSMRSDDSLGFEVRCPSDQTRMVINSNN